MARKERSNEVCLPPPPGTVVLEQAGQFVHITAPVVGLERWIYTVLHLRVHDAVGGACLAPLTDPLVVKVTRDGQTSQCCGAGLKPLVKELLERHGLRVEVRESRRRRSSRQGNASPLSSASITPCSPSCATTTGA
jgi:hypothetical protein